MNIQVFLLFLSIFMLQLSAFSENKKQNFIKVEWHNVKQAKKELSHCRSISFEKPYVIDIDLFEDGACKGLTQVFFFETQYKQLAKKFFLEDVKAPYPYFHKKNESFPAELQLMKPGPFGLYKIDLNYIAKRLPSLKIRAFPWGKVNAESTKKSAAYFPQKNMYIINDDMKKINENYRRIVEKAIRIEQYSSFIIHELLGALGLYDRHYEVSTALWWAHRNAYYDGMNWNITRETMRSLAHFLKKEAKHSWKQIADGGATSVSGGGEIDEAAFKISLLNLNKQKNRKMFPREKESSIISGTFKKFIKIQERIIFSKVKIVDKKICKTKISRCIKYIPASNSSPYGTITLPRNWAHSFVVGIQGQKPLVNQSALLSATLPVITAIENEVLHD